MKNIIGQALIDTSYPREQLYIVNLNEAWTWAWFRRLDKRGKRMSHIYTRIDGRKVVLAQHRRSIADIEVMQADYRRRAGL